MQAIARHIRISPKKANLMAMLVREKNVNQALTLLKFTPKKGARLLYKVINSAASNAEHNFKQDRQNLYISEIMVGKAGSLRRILPVSRGRAHPLRKIMSHIKVTLSVKEGKKETKKDKKVSQKTPAKKTTKTVVDKKINKK